jgi:hypothetical protein
MIPLWGFFPTLNPVFSFAGQIRQLKRGGWGGGVLGRGGKFFKQLALWVAGSGEGGGENLENLQLSTRPG